MNNAPFAQKLSHITEPYHGKNDQMQVIGLCRFSYPALGGFQREHETIEQRKAFLYDEAHLKHRLRLFRAFNLPSILAQTDTDFQYLILVGNDLPVWARDQLNDLTKWADHIKILPYPSHPHRQIAEQVILDHLDVAHAHSIQFRLDDDAVHRTFIERLKTTAAVGVIDYANKPRFALDYARGYAIRPSAVGLQAEELVRNLWTPALAAVFKTSANNTVMNFGHHKLDQHMPVISD
ncbi:MAG: hypothetical protein EBX06_09920 [Rhodobacteraceae bacterium]|nr:hypothetical protein [Paracoccaceae bacterium]